MRGVGRSRCRAPVLWLSTRLMSAVALCAFLRLLHDGMRWRHACCMNRADGQGPRQEPPGAPRGDCSPGGAPGWPGRTSSPFFMNASRCASGSGVGRHAVACDQGSGEYGAGRRGCGRSSCNLPDDISPRPARGSQPGACEGRAPSPTQSGKAVRCAGARSFLSARAADSAEDHLDRAPAAARPAPRLAVRIRLSRRGHPCRSK